MTINAETTELPHEEMERVQGGEGTRAEESLSINFTKIEYKYTPYDDHHK